MTLIRKLADGISRGVVRRARPGAKEWAEATAREMELIESDWSALAWALGSLRILRHGCASPVTSLAQVPQAASKFAREIRRRTVMGSASCGFIAICYFRFGSHPIFGRHAPHHMMGRVGAYLTAAAALYMIGQLLVRRGRLPSKGDTAASASEYRIELERQSEFHCGFWLWSRIWLMAPGYLLFCTSLRAANAVGAMLKFSSVFGFLILCVIAVPLNLRKARQYQRRVDELDVLENAG